MYDFVDDLIKAVAIVACLVIGLPVAFIVWAMGGQIYGAITGQCIQLPMSSDSCHFDMTFYLVNDTDKVVEVFLVQSDGTERLLAPSLLEGRHEMERWLAMPDRCTSKVLVARDHAGNELGRRSRTCWGDVWTISAPARIGRSGPFATSPSSRAPSIL